MSRETMHPFPSLRFRRRDSVLTATAGQLVVLLYDGLTRDLGQAEAALEDGATARARHRLQRAEAILEELRAALDRDAGDVASRLEAIYVFCARLLREARLAGDPERVREAARLLGSLREAWAEIAGVEPAGARPA